MASTKQKAKGETTAKQGAKVQTGLDLAKVNDDVRALLESAAPQEAPELLQYAKAEELAESGEVFVVIGASRRESNLNAGKFEYRYKIVMVETGEALFLTLGENEQRADLAARCNARPVGPCRVEKREMTSGKWKGSEYNDIVAVPFKK